MVLINIRRRDMNDITVKYQKTAIVLLSNFRQAYNDAPTRSGYSKLTGSYATTKNDLLRDFKANWAMHQACYEVESGSNKKLMECKLPEVQDVNPLDD